MTINEDSIKLAPARECCDACGREMTPADYDGLHATVHVGMSFTIDGCPCMGDSWTLLCADCYAAFRDVFFEFKRKRAEL